MSGQTLLDFVPARLPEAVTMTPGAYEVIRPEASSEDSENDTLSNTQNEDDSASSDVSSDVMDNTDSESESEESRTDLESDDETEAKPAKSESAKPQHDEPTEPVFYDFNENPKDRGSRPKSRIFKSWQPLARAPVGLENRGVTCYMNAAIQSLFHLPAVGRYLTEVANNCPDNIKRSSVTVELANLFKKVTEPKKSKVYPAKIIRRLEDINCMMSEWDQEDSHEYFMSLLSRLQEDSVPPGQKLNTSILHEIFGGTFEQKVTCQTCGHVSTTKQDFYDLPVSLSRSESKAQKYTLQQSIKDFFSTETLTPKGQEGYQCEKCKNVTKAWKQNFIEDAPEYLTIHIKRFKFEGSTSQKVKDPVTYPIDLDMSSYVKTEDNLRYKLTCVIVHEGRTVSSGHYIALCRQPNNEWVEYDDDMLRKVSEKTAKSNDASYILIYSRLAEKNRPSGAKKTASSVSTTVASSPRRKSVSAAKPPLMSPIKEKKLKIKAHKKAELIKRHSYKLRSKEEAKIILTRAQQQLAQKRSAHDDIDKIFKKQKA